MRYCWGTIGVLLFAALPARAGSVQTVSGRLEGKVALHKDYVNVGDKKVPWEDILYLVPEPAGKLLLRPQWVHLNNGESWAVELVSLAEGELTVRSDLFGLTKIDVKSVRAIDFARQRGRGGKKAETLYRARGEPIPGKLVAIKADKVVMDSVVGMIDLPREGLRGYRFTEEAADLKRGQDEVTLIDGSVFRGKLRLGADELRLEHPVLEPLTLPVRIVQSAVRHPATVLDLTEARPDSVETAALLSAQKTDVAQFRPLRDLDVKSGRFIKGLGIGPKTVVHYKLPKGAGKIGRLRMTLLPTPAARGDARLKISAADKVLIDKAVAPNAKAEALDVEVAAGADLEIVVDFGERLRFPCGVVLGDAHVVWEKR